MSEVKRSYRVEGRVQGVGFRMWTREQAGALDLRGWVRNEPDGSVRVEVAGPAERVSELEARLRRGPAAASVSSVAERGSAGGLPDAGFEIRRA